MFKNCENWAISIAFTYSNFMKGMMIIKRKLYTKEVIAIEIANLYKDYKLVCISELKGVHSIVYLYCNKCGEILKYDFNNLRMRYKEGRGCKFCSGKFNNTKSFNKKIKKAFPNNSCTMISDYKGDKIESLFKCDKCGKTFTSTPQLVMDTVGGSCKFCRTKPIYDIEVLQDKIDKVRPGYTVLEIPKDFKGISRSNVKFRHDCCDTEFEMRPNNLMKQKREPCKKCREKSKMFNPSNLSKGAEFIKKFLDSNGINYEIEKTFNDLISPYSNKKLRIDFYIPEICCAIEFDGKFHSSYSENSTIFSKENMEKTKIRDKTKDEYCKNKGIKMVRIDYIEIGNFNGLKKLNEVKNLYKKNK